MNIKKFTALMLTLITVILLLVSCNKNDKTVMTISGFDVPYHVYRYVVVNSRKDIEKTYGEDVWKSDNAEEAKAELSQNIKNSLANFYTVCTIGAEYGFTWNDGSVYAEAKIQRDNMMLEYEEEEDFEKELKELSMTKDTLLFTIANDVMNNESYTAMVTADEKLSDKEHLSALFTGDELIRVKQILVGGENGGTDEQNKKKADELKARLDAGEDFDTVSRSYNNDLFMFENEDGYYIMRGTRNFEFEEAAFSLDINQISDVVKTDAGYSIIIRLEKDDAYIEEHFEELANEYYETLYTAKYESTLEKVLSEMPALPEKYDIITLE